MQYPSETCRMKSFDLRISNSNTCQFPKDISSGLRIGKSHLRSTTVSFSSKALVQVTHDGKDALRFTKSTATPEKPEDEDERAHGDEHEARDEGSFVRYGRVVEPKDGRDKDDEAKELEEIHSSKSNCLDRKSKLVWT